MPVGTLYVIGAPGGESDDLTLRAQRILREVKLIVGTIPEAKRLLDRYGLAPPFVPLSDLTQPDFHQQVLEALERDNAALLLPGLSPGLPGNGDRLLIQSVLARGLPVMPVPGPTRTITDLIMSGLPADSFVYLGWLPGDALRRRTLLTPLSGERHTLIALASPEHLPAILSDLRDVLGLRPLVAVALNQRPEKAWRGTVYEAMEHLPLELVESPYLLIVGGIQQEAAAWSEDRLRAEIRARLEQNLGTREVSRQLASESGWPRRRIYRLTVEARRSRDDE
jgi:16S rRNA (cytidine1402-2'-O)-methyltransferase